MGAIELAGTNNPASSASAAEDMTNLMIWATLRSGPLSRGTASYSDRNIYEPASLQALVSLRYAASEFPQSTTLLTQ